MADDRPWMREDVRDWLAGLGAEGSDPVLAEMHALAKERRFPIVGPEVGRLLHQVTRMVSAKRIFELGSGFGYSTLWFARAAGPGATIWHTEGDAANMERARDFLGRAGVADRVRFYVGDARDAIQEVAGDFDIVFCDIDKDQYPSAYELFADRVRPGGAVIVDNLVWSGKVASGVDDPATNGAREYVRRMWSDPRYLSSLLPIRDGVGLSLRVA